MHELDLGSGIAESFVRVARDEADRIAVCTPAGQWTYAELLARSRAVASALLDQDGAGEGRVALLFEHGLHSVAAILGTILAGKAYVPMDAAYPLERMTTMLEDSGATALVFDAQNEALARQLGGGVRTRIDLSTLRPASLARPVEATPGEYAYVLYTSGSTGAPKGVAQTQHNLLHHIDVWIRACAMGPEDRVSLQSAYGWDSAMQDTFAALLSGATLYPVRFKELGIEGLLRWLRGQAITVYHSTVPIFRAVSTVIRRERWRWPSLRVLALGGDLIHRQDIEAFEACFEPGSYVLNSYGATESSSVLMNRHDHGETLETEVFPVGKPVLRTRVELVGDEPDRGEIIVYSEHIAPGYWGQPASEDPRFIVDAHGRVCGYRSGDLGIRGPDGRIRVSGRLDRQVKIDGIRVDPGEVEAALKALPTVVDAVVVATMQGREHALVGYVVSSASPWDAAALDRQLRARLPAHCVPRRLVAIEAFPLNAHGKLDYAALAAITPEDERGAGPIAAPSGPLERTLVEVWSSILGVARVGVDQSFFDLGGSSLKLAMVGSELRARTGIEVAMVTLYRYPSIRTLAQALEHGDAGNRARTRAASRGARRRELRAK